MKKTNPSGRERSSAAPYARSGRPSSQVATTIAVGSGSTPSSWPRTRRPASVEECDRLVGRGRLEQVIVEVVDRSPQRSAHGTASLSVRPDRIAGLEESGSRDHALVIPADLLPGDGRFGSGPAKIRPESVHALAADGAGPCSAPRTARPPVRNLVGDVQVGLAQLFALPDGYEVVLGNGGSTLFWDVATFSLIRHRSAHASFGEFSAKFAAAAAAAPHLDAAQRGHRRGRLGRRAQPPSPEPTSTPGRTTRPRPAPSPRSGGSHGADPRRAGGGRRHLGGRRHDGRRPEHRRLLLRAAEEPRLGRRAVAGDHVAGRARAGRRDRRLRPLDPRQPRACRSRSTTRGPNQTLNTPAIATLFLLRDQLRLAERPGRTEVRGRAHRRLGEPDLRLGRGVGVRDAVRPGSGAALAGRRDHRLRGRRRGDDRAGCSGPTAWSTPSPIASSAATSCGSAMYPSGRTRRRQPAHPLHRLAHRRGQTSVALAR